MAISVNPDSPQIVGNSWVSYSGSGSQIYQYQIRVDYSDMSGSSVIDYTSLCTTKKGYTYTFYTGGDADVVISKNKTGTSTVSGSITATTDGVTYYAVCLVAGSEDNSYGFAGVKVTAPTVISTKTEYNYSNASTPWIPTNSTQSPFPASACTSSVGCNSQCETRTVTTYSDGSTSATDWSGYKYDFTGTWSGPSWVSFGSWPNNGAYVDISIAANTSTSSSRSGTISYTYQGTTKSLSVSQDADSIDTASTYTRNEYQIEYASATTTNFNAAGGSSSLSVNVQHRIFSHTVYVSGTIKEGTTDWGNIGLAGSWSSDSDWISISNNKSFTVSANEQGTARTGTLTFTGGPPNSGTATVTISQDADSVASTDYKVEISIGKTSFTAASSSTSLTGTITKKSTWVSGNTTSSTVSGGTWSVPNWTSKSGSTLYINANTATSSRSGSVTYSYGGSSDSVTISQDADSKTGEYDTSYEYYASASATNSSFSAVGGSSTLVGVPQYEYQYTYYWVSGDTTTSSWYGPYTGSGGSWSKSSSDTWVTLGTASGNNMPFSVSINHATDSRTCTITYTYNGVSDTVTISQGADTIESLTLTLTPSSIEYGETSTPTVKANWVSGDVTDVTNSATYTSGDTSVATITTA